MNLKLAGAGVVLAVVLYAGGYATGRYAAPQKVLITEKAVTVEKQVVVTQTKTEIKTVYLQNKNEKIHRVVTETKQPDGTAVKKTEEDIGIETVIHNDTESTKFVDRWNERVMEKLVEKEKLVLRSLPDWQTGIQVGASVPVLLGGDELGLKGMRGAVVGAYVNRRILGPFFAGIWGNTQGAVGLSVVGEF